MISFKFSCCKCSAIDLFDGDLIGVTYLVFQKLVISLQNATWIAIRPAVATSAPFRMPLSGLICHFNQFHDKFIDGHIYIIYIDDLAYHVV